MIEPEALLADKGYDADHFTDSPIARAIKVVIPPKSNRKVPRFAFHPNELTSRRHRSGVVAS